MRNNNYLSLINFKVKTSSSETFFLNKDNVGYCELNNHDQKIRRTPTHDIREHWTAVSTLLGLISSVYRNLHHWRSNQQSQITIPKHYN